MSALRWMTWSVSPPEFPSYFAMIVAMTMVNAVAFPALGHTPSAPEFMLNVIGMDLFHWWRTARRQSS